MLRNVLKGIGRLVGNERGAEPASPATDLCLVMIVKDEEQEIRSTLESALPFVSSYYILDTGSSDRTMEIIRETLDGKLPGKLLQDEWRGYAASRNQALDGAREMLGMMTALGVPYLIMLDGGERIEIAPNAPDFELTLDGYKLMLRKGGIEYPQLRVFRSTLPWSYVGDLHEVPTPSGPHSEAVIEHVKILERPVRAQDDVLTRIARYTEHAVEFEKKVAADPNDTRSWFYLAQSYEDSLQMSLALETYEKRAAMMHGYIDETFIAKLRVARIRDQLGMPIEVLRNAFLDAYNFMPSRAEPLYTLGYKCRALGLFAEGAMYQRQAARIARPSDQALFVEYEIYAWRAKDELSVNLYWTGHYMESLQIARALIASSDVPEDQKGRMRENARFCFEKLAETGEITLPPLDQA